MFFQQCLERGFPILSPDWGWARFPARSAPISKTSLGPRGLLSCLRSSSSPRSPPPQVFKALKPEDFYPSSSLCCEHQASAHTCPGHVHLAVSGPLNLPQPQPTCPQTHTSALTVPQSSPAVSPNSTLPAALTGQTPVSSCRLAQRHMGQQGKTPLYVPLIPSHGYGTIKTPAAAALPPLPTWEPGGQGQAVWGLLVPSAHDWVAAGGVDAKVAALLGLSTWEKRVPLDPL